MDEVKEDNHFVAHPEGGVTTESQIAAEKAKAEEGTGAVSQAALDAEAQREKEADEKGAVLAGLQAEAERTAAVALEARANADELVGALTDASTDEEKAAADEAQVEAEDAEAISEEAKAKAEAAAQ